MRCYYIDRGLYSIILYCGLFAAMGAKLFIYLYRGPIRRAGLFTRESVVRLRAQLHSASAHANARSTPRPYFFSMSACSAASVSERALCSRSSLDRLPPRPLPLRPERPYRRKTHRACMCFFPLFDFEDRQRLRLRMLDGFRGSSSTGSRLFSPSASRGRWRNMVRRSCVFFRLGTLARVDVT